MSSLNANRKRPHVTEASNKDTKSSIESRLERLEGIIKSLTSSVDETLLALSATPSRRDLNKLPIESNQIIVSEADRPDPELFIGPSHAFSFFQEAPAGIERLPPQGVEDSRQSVISEIQNMSSSLTSAKMANPMKDTTTNFHVPSRSVGYALLSSELIPLPFIVHCCWIIPLTSDSSPRVFTLFSAW